MLAMPFRFRMLWHGGLTKGRVGAAGKLVRRRMERRAWSGPFPGQIVFTSKAGPGAWRNRAWRAGGNKAGQWSQEKKWWGGVHGKRKGLNAASQHSKKQRSVVRSAVGCGLEGGWGRAHTLGRGLTAGRQRRHPKHSSVPLLAGRAAARRRQASAQGATRRASCTAAGSCGMMQAAACEGGATQSKPRCTRARVTRCEGGRAGRWRDGTRKWKGRRPFKRLHDRAAYALQLHASEIGSAAQRSGSPPAGP